MSNSVTAGAVLFAKDIARVAKFYADIVPMTVTHSESDHIVLESAQFQLVLHGIPKRIAKTIVIASPPKRRENTPIKLVFWVDKIARAREQAAALGGELNPAKKEWEARGFRACDGHDPEGNVVQFREDAV